MTVGSAPVKIDIRNLTVSYGSKAVLHSVSLPILRNEILAVIGPANSGKSTLLRALNRTLELTSHAQVSGQVLLDGEDILAERDARRIRQRIGIVFALPVPLPLTVFENVAYGPRRLRTVPKSELPDLVKESLEAAFLWEEVKDRLNEPAMNLSGGQQQRLCIARTLAVRPEVILFDEPCSGLDPISTAKVEEAMQSLKQQYTLVLVTNLTAQAARVSDRTAFLLSGELVEMEATAQLFTRPADSRTRDYIEGRFG
ncbi:MAG: phosphate ABC transporter ATP-binding protein [Candidatus Zipacnadales bacterium]